MTSKKSLLIVFLFWVIIFVPIFDVEAVTKEPIKILLVPGHDDEVWGAQYGNIKEANMNLALTTRLYNILKKDKRFKVYITRDNHGYTEEFKNYFVSQEEEIISFIKKAKEKTKKKIDEGNFIEKANPPHQRASEDMAIRLYGFNKWANENGISAVIHVHFNDYPRLDKWLVGKYKGFNIYIPDGQLVNWEESGQLAAKVFTELHKKYSVSTYGPEINGLTADQKLIAVGANGTLNASVRSILIEYSYIYEKRLRSKSTRTQAYTDMASLTATGVKKYFFPK